MIPELITVHLPTFVFGLVVGIAITRLQVKLALQKRDIGKLIDLAFIEKNVSQLKSLTSSLNSLVEQISENSLELREQIKGSGFPLSKMGLEIEPLDDRIRS